MNFGQALDSLLNGNSISRSGWQRQGMKLGLGAPTGVVTQPFIWQRLANGETSVYCPDQGDILATDWNVVDGAGTQEQSRQHAHAGT